MGTMRQKIIPIDSLSDTKKARLGMCTTQPQFYVSVEGWSINKSTNIVYYTCEVGIQLDEEVLVFTTLQRYSDLYKLNKSLKTDMKLNFPKKKFFRNTEVEFVRQRFYELQKYMIEISRLPTLMENTTFKILFHSQEMHNAWESACERQSFVVPLSYSF